MKRTDLQIALTQRGLRLVDLARTLQVDKATVTRWSQGRVPAERVVDIERITGISRHDLRPDIFGAKPAEAA